MRAIWNIENPISSKDIATIMEGKKGWKKTTTLTLLSRLAEKNFIKAEKGKKITYYTPIVSKKSYLSLETSSFFKNVHKNSLKSFVTTLNESNDISDKDIEELKEWIKSR